MSERRGNNSQAQRLQALFNHAFDGHARSKGATPDELFGALLVQMEKNGLGRASLEDILAACRKAEANHTKLAEMGHMSPESARRANEAVFDLLKRFIARKS